MSIVLARIDNRLIHGQVLESWVPHTRANCIVVASDSLAALPMQKLLMKAAVPKGIRVEIESVEMASQLIGSREMAGSRILVLFSTSADSLHAYQLGMGFEELNLGNMHGGEGKIRVSCTLALDEEDVQNLRCLEEGGVHIVSQCFPSDRKLNWEKLIPVQKKQYGL